VFFFPYPPAQKGFTLLDSLFYPTPSILGNFKGIAFEGGRVGSRTYF
jgi:hypothetical protein